MRRWRAAKEIYFKKRRHCRGAYELRGRVSVFGGGLEASGHFTSEPGIALNIAAGTDAGWDNATTRGWLSKLQRFRVTIEGHTAILPVTDLGPAGWVNRSIDVTEGAAAALGLSVGAFPTDEIGTAQLIPDGCL